MKIILFELKMSQIKNFHLNTLDISEPSENISVQFNNKTNDTLYSVTLYSSLAFNTTSSTNNTSYLTPDDSNSSETASLYLPSSISYSSNHPGNRLRINGFDSNISEAKNGVFSFSNASSDGKFKNSSFKAGFENITDENQHNVSSMSNNGDYVNLINELINLKADLTKFRADLVLNELKIELNILAERIKTELNEQFMRKFKELDNKYSTLNSRVSLLELALRGETSVADTYNYSNINITRSYINTHIDDEGILLNFTNKVAF